MTVDQILEEIKDRADDQNLQNSLLLTKINNEYDQTNLAISNLNEDYFFTETTLAVTTSRGPYNLPSDFAKIRALIRPSGGSPVSQVSPASDSQSYGWYFSGVTLSGGTPVKRITINPDPAGTTEESGNYTLRYVGFPVHLDLTTNTVPLWPEPFHEILILGALKRLFSVQDIYDKFPDLKADLAELKDEILALAGGQNLGASRDVDTSSDPLG